MKFLIFFITLLLTTQAFAFGSKRVTTLDPVTTSTLLDGDATGLAEGCGQQPSPLGMFCRQTEGDVAAKSIFFIGPPAKCDRDQCVFIKVWNTQGQLVFGDGIPKNQTRIEVPWKTLLGRDTFQLADRGYWTFNTTVYFIGPDGNERSAVSQGDIVMRVFRAGYVPLNAVENDPNFIWTWTEGGTLYKMTAGLRAFAKQVSP